MTQLNKYRTMSPKQAAACCRPVDDMLDPFVFKALGDPTRLALVACLIKCGRPASVSEIAECCDVDFSVVSRHLRVLEDAGVLTAKKAGRTVFFAFDHHAIAGTFRALADAILECRPKERGSKSEGGCCETR